MPQSDGDIARRFEQAASKNKARHNTASSPREVKAQTVHRKCEVKARRAVCGARVFVCKKSRRFGRWTKAAAVRAEKNRARQARSVFPHALFNKLGLCCRLRVRPKEVCNGKDQKDAALPHGGEHPARGGGEGESPVASAPEAEHTGVLPLPGISGPRHDPPENIKRQTLEYLMAMSHAEAEKKEMPNTDCASTER